MSQERQRQRDIERRYVEGASDAEPREDPSPYVGHTGAARPREVGCRGGGLSASWSAGRQRSRALDELLWMASGLAPTPEVDDPSQRLGNQGAPEGGPGWESPSP